MSTFKHVRILGCILLAVPIALVGASCTPPEDSPPRLQACAFALQAGKTKVHGSEREDWEAIQKDIVKAEKYVDGFWTRHWGECFKGVSYQRPRSEGVYTSDNPVTCGEDPVSADNAFYCRDGKFVAYGSELMHRAVDEGDALAYQVVAHEWGHAIQDLLRGTEFGSYVSEQGELQADCLAGAALWGSDYEGYFEWQPGDSAEAAAALESIADETEWTKRSPTGEASHGDALERIGAFQRGRALTGITDCFNMGVSHPEPSVVPVPTEDPTPAQEPTAEPTPTLAPTPTPAPTPSEQPTPTQAPTPPGSVKPRGDATASRSATGHDMQLGEFLQPENRLSSANREFELVFQSDGNLVLYGRGRALWASDTQGHVGGWCTFQTDGNLVVYGENGVPLWATGTHGRGGNQLTVQDDGNVVIYTADERPLWASGKWRSG